MPPPPAPVPPQPPGESPVPPEGYLTECQKLHSVMKEAERSVVSTQELIAGLQTQIAELESDLAEAKAALDDKRKAEGGAFVTPPKPGTPPQAAVAESLLGLLAREAGRKRQIEENAEKYYDGEYWAMTADQVKSRAIEIEKSIRKIESEIKSAQNKLVERRADLAAARDHYVSRCSRDNAD